MSSLRRSIIGAAVVAAAPCALGGCRGMESERTPIHIVQNMDDQQRYDPQEPNPMFHDGRGMRPQVPGTVAFGPGQLKDDDHLHRGRGPDGEYADALPESIPISAELLDRGRQRYDIYCAPCHDRTGVGGGLVVSRGFNPPPTFHQDSLRERPLGYFYEVITNGIRVMPAYATQVGLRDRWAIAVYVRALQVSQNATLAQVPKDVVGTKGWGGAAP